MSRTPFRNAWISSLISLKRIPYRFFRWVIGLGLLSFLVSCSEPVQPTQPIDLGSLNSPYADQQPALSGDGRFVAFVSDRTGNCEILLYDLQQQQFVELPRLNRKDAIADSPSLSYTARYIVYTTSDRGRPDIELYDRLTQQIKVFTAGYRGWVRHPSISPDGRYITFETGSQGQWDIELIDRGARVELDRPDRAIDRAALSKQ